MRTDRLPPQNLEAERAVIGAWLLENSKIDECAIFLRADDFYRDSHQIIAAKILEMRGDSRPVDFVSLADEMTRDGTYKRIGGDESLLEISNAAPHAANAVYHAHIVRQKSTVRQLAQSCTEILEGCYANQQTSSDLLEDAERRILDIGQRDLSCETRSLGVIMQNTLNEMEARQRGEIQNIPTCFGELNRFIDGFTNEELILIGGRPSQGKTAIAMQIGVWISLTADKEVLAFSLEMSENALCQRLISSWTGIPGDRIKKTWLLDAEDHRNIGICQDAFNNARFHVNEDSHLTVQQIASICRRHKARQGLNLVIIDYLQLIDSKREDGDNRQEQVAKIGRRLKQLARELKVPVVCLSQLNRQNESREDKRPRLSDLRESGSLEQDADVVMFVHRPEYYDPMDEPGIAELIVAKNRNGPTGTARLNFVNTYTRFENIVVEVPLPQDPGERGEVVQEPRAVIPMRREIQRGYVDDDGNIVPFDPARPY